MQWDWQKQGLIFCPDGSVDWMQSHAQVPVVDPVSPTEWNIYFSSRDAQNQSRIGCLTVDASHPQRILKVGSTPILDLGPLGSFDDCGVMPAWALNINHQKYLYYIGWTTRQTVPYHNTIGLAISQDEGRTFHRATPGPLFGPTPEEPYFTGTVCVRYEEGLFRAWYLSCTRWEVIDGHAEPFYHLKYATSFDGIHWDRRGRVAIDFQSSEEGGIVNASVLPIQGKYVMWYAYRKARGYRTDKNASYRIGYAESNDGVAWQRLDHQSGIERSETGWDSQMQAYPHVMQINNRYYMFYNGNGFGQSGFGYATTSQPKQEGQAV